MCLKIAFWQLCVTVCGRFVPNEGGAAGYVDRIRGKYTAKQGVQMTEMNFQTHSNAIIIAGTRIICKIIAGTAFINPPAKNICQDTKNTRKAFFSRRFWRIPSWYSCVKSK
ncbi:DUF6783 domain-containing protein [Clostridium sp. MCC353]|uniref:DUF6783 domain-containing protein n=1 Tax=Clostridium sp. MCC353 TaxID=2592646 RepID=UPI0031FEE4A1